MCAPQIETTTLKAYTTPPPLKSIGSAEHHQHVLLKSRVRDQSLWFDDGTVILTTSTTIFRVYRGILSSNSSVFRDMFFLPQNATVLTSDSLDGVPVVHLHDDPQDLAHLLGALHHQSYFTHRGKCEFSIVAALLRLSTKYQMDALRQQVISHLAAMYPSNLSEFDRSYAERGATTLSDVVKVINIARETHAYILLPVACYRIVELTDEVCIHYLGQFFNEMSKDDAMMILFSRSKLQHALFHDILSFVTESSPGYSDDCDDEQICAAARDDLISSPSWNTCTDNPGVLRSTLTDSMQDHLQGLCPSCRKLVEFSIKYGRERVWDKLPMFFGLDDWNALRISSGLEEKDETSEMNNS